ncbi:MAG: TolC family protein [Gammaproteobacteria bacterium]|nr:TolC family protein [Gammaproteobacteria bacterium]
MLLARSSHRLLSILFCTLALLLALPSFAQQRFVVGHVSDGERDRFSGREQQYTDELMALAGSEFQIELKRFQGNGDTESVQQAIDAVYADPDIDLVLVTGFLSNQISAIRNDYPKPTFLPVVVDTGLFVNPPVDGTSGIENLNYLSVYANFAADLETLSRFVVYRKLVLFVDEELAGSIPQLRVAANEASNQRGVELILVTHDGVDHRLMERIPAGTDAVFVAGLPRMPPTDFARFVDAINTAGLPSYSFAGVDDVERGLLVTDTEPRDIARQARLNALNMQAVMLGERAEDQPITTQHKEQLTINMDTARKIGLSPSFDVLSEAVLLNREEKVTGDELGLVDIANLALAQNQDLKAETFGTRAGLEEIARARANLLPQLGASASYTLRKDSPSVVAGILSERSTDAALSIDQLLYSDAAVANLKIQKELQKTRISSLQQFRLDVVQAATSAYYAVLNARSQLAVQENNFSISKANLELAENRVRLGTSTPADVYRWQAELARAQISVLNSRATLDQLWDSLNRILHQPQGTRIALREATFNEPFVMTKQEFDQLVASPADYARFSRFYIDRALQQAPELQQLTAQIAAKRRELVSQRRAYWLPDFSVGGRYTSNLSQSGLGAGLSAGQDLNDWSVGVQATLPLFSGGLKKANVSRASFELRQLEALRISTEERVEEEVRSQLHATQAAYAQIDLSAIAAEASSKNFKLVSDAYARGTVTVIELLDAQDSSIAASAAAAESLYSFLTTIMAMQRAVGGYDFLLSPEARDGLAGEFRRTLSTPNR